MFSVGSAGPRGCIRGLRTFRQKGSKRFKKAQKGAKGLTKALEKAFQACPVPPVRPKAVRACFGAACAFEEAVRDCCSRSLFESAGLGYTVL